jgi:hypothetical protein
MMLGYMLGYNGMLRGQSEADKYSNQENFERLQGMQNYSLNFGDKSYTVDWLAPISLPLFVGVELANMAKEEDFNFGQLLDSMSGITDPVFNLSMLQGINSMVNTGFKGGGVPAILQNALTGYANQFNPTVFGQLARTFDTERRTTKAIAESDVGREVETFGRTQLAKLPGASRKLEPFVNLWGQTEKKQGGADYARSAFENFLSPGYLKDKDTSSVNKEIERLASVIDEPNDVYPKTSNTAYSIDKEQRKMNEKEFTEFQKVRGQYAFRTLQMLFNSNKYIQATDQEKAAMVNRVHKDALDEAKSTLL